MTTPGEDSLVTASAPFLARLSNNLHIWLRWIGVDWAVLFGVLTRVWQLLASPVSLLLIARYLTPEMQGFYYTFASLLALQSFMELALYLVIINTASHEWAFLSLDSAGKIVGEPNALSRLVSLGRFIFKWYAIASAVFVFSVWTVGYVFFSQQSYHDIAWQAPWLMLVLLAGLQMWALPFNSLLEGCNQVATIQKFRFSQAILGSLVMWLAFVLGMELWVAVVAAAVGLLRDVYLLGVQYRNFFRTFFKPPSGLIIHWRSDIWPMQWRLGLSGVVNYFAFSLFNPVMFQYHGASVAGQMGMTLVIVGAVQSVATMWVYPKVPQFGILIAQKDYVGLDRFWLRTSLLSVVVVIGGAGAAWLLVYGINTFYPPLAQRMLPPLPTGLFLLAAIIMQISQCETAYLRAHKQEPIVVLGVVSSIAIGISVWVFGGRFGPVGAATGYLTLMAGMVLPWETLIWFRCRKEWHKA